MKKVDCDVLRLEWHKLYFASMKDSATELHLKFQVEKEVTIVSLCVDATAISLHLSPTTAAQSSYIMEQSTNNIARSKLTVSNMLYCRYVSWDTSVLQSWTSTARVSLRLALTFDVGEKVSTTRYVICIYAQLLPIETEVAQYLLVHLCYALLENSDDRFQIDVDRALAMDITHQQFPLGV